MNSCLGLYIEDKLIKYAKVSKSNETIKVESFGIKFYDNLISTIEQVIEETYSFKIPISINTTDEIYNKLQVFSMLAKKDRDGVIKTEFENICYDKETNANLYEQRYIFSNINVQTEKIGVIHVSVPKSSIAQKKNQLSQYRINGLYPVSVTVANLLGEKEAKGNSLIVNIEKNTTITKVSNNLISDIEFLPYGTKDILDNINQKENSYSKAYDICKATTIYTENDKDLQYEENENLEDIMPTLYKIVSEVRKKAEDSFENIEKVYITGTGAIINNIDIYFQEYLKSISCEVLKPSFVGNNSKINIKDYIEVNSAISLAVQNLGNNNTLNFVKESSISKFRDLFTSDIFNNQDNGIAKNIDDFLAKYDRQYNLTFFSILLITLTYLVGSTVINNKLLDKKNKVNQTITKTNEQISKIQSYNSLLNSRISEYKRLSEEFANFSNNSSIDKRYKNTIPNLLNNIMVIIPKEVQLVSIENTADTHIAISAKSSKYEQIAFFKTKLKMEGVLENVVSDTGTMKDGTITVTIEGELP